MVGVIDVEKANTRKTRRASLYEVVALLEGGGLADVGQTLIALPEGAASSMHFADEPHPEMKGRRKDKLFSDFICLGLFTPRCITAQ